MKIVNNHIEQSVIDMSSYLNNFLFFAILGFIYENILQLILTGDFTSNPFYGPWMPIYGFGVIIMIFLTRLIFNNLKIKRWQKIIILFISVTVILTIIELVGGYLTEFIFHKSFWNYTDMKYNFGKYISLEVSLVWGTACLIFLYVVKPLTDKFIKKIPKFISIILLILIIIDFIFSFFLK